MELAIADVFLREEEFGVLALDERYADVREIEQHLWYYTDPIFASPVPQASSGIYSLGIPSILIFSASAFITLLKLAAFSCFSKT